MTTGLQRRGLMVSALAGVGLLCGCAPAPKAAAPANVVRVAVLRDGRILADGRAVDAAELDRILARTAEASGAVWYYREGSGDDPAPPAEAAMQTVLEAVVRHRLPISLSTLPDFSDVVDASGRSRPRSQAESAH